MMRMPQNGDRYRARDDVTVQLLAMHGEVGMSYSNAVIPRGEMIEIEGEVNVANEVSGATTRRLRPRV